MAYMEMTLTELRAIEIASQDDTDLDKENGIFCNNKWRFEEETIETNQFIRKYTNVKNGDIIYLISFLTGVFGNETFSNYKFYKEV